MTPARIRAATIFMIISVSLGALVALGFASYQANRDAQDAQVINKVVELVDGIRRTVTLPIAWRGARGEVQERVFEVAVPTPPIIAPVYLHLPFYEQSVMLTIGGVAIHDTAATRAWGGATSQATALILIPADRLDPVNTLITLTVRSGPNPPGVLSPILVGPVESLRGIYLLRSFIEETVKPILYGMQVFLALTGLLIFALRPSDTVFGWMGLMLSFTVVAGSSVLARALPNVGAFMETMFLLIPAAGLSILGFTMALAGRPGAKRLIPLILVSLPCLLVLRFGVGLSADWVGFFISIPVLVLSALIGTGYLVVAIRREPRIETVLFAVGLCAFALAVTRDTLIRLGVLDTGLFLGQVSRGIVLAALAVFIVRRQSEIANRLDRATEDLRQKLAVREAELTKAHERERAREASRIIQEERNRVTADLHDGVAGHLTAIIALSETPSGEPERIRASARNALVDLRLVLDALSVPKGDLLYYLGQFRERAVDPLQALDCDVSWSMAQLPEMPNIGREKALSLLRILQEAVNNALRHCELERLDIRGDTPAEGLARIIVRNEGALCKDGTSGGHGLRNMTKRAAVLGGTAHLQLFESGAELTITFPV